MENLCVNIVILSYFPPQIVLVNNVFWEVAQFEPHIFIVRHGRVEVEILNVDGHEL